MRYAFSGALAAILMFALPAAADPVTPDASKGQIQSYAADNAYSYYRYRHWFHYHTVRTQGPHSSDLAGAIPAAPGTYTATSNRGTSTTTYGYDANTGVIQLDFGHSVAASNGGYQYGYGYARSYGQIYFDVAAGASVDYTLSGLYSGQLGDGDDYFRALTQLTRIGPSGNQVIFSASNLSRSSGELAIDENSTGASGTLTEGTYMLNFDRLLYAGHWNAASGSGGLTLDLHAVPEPGTWALLGLAGLALAFCRRP